MADVNYAKSWRRVVDSKEASRILAELSTMTNFEPSVKDIFNAFKLCDYNNLKCIILGMDPYPQKGIATGLAFANKDDLVSPSLEIIRNSFYLDPVENALFDPTLNHWAQQGVLLLNSALTVEIGKPGSHSMLWRNFTINFLKKLSEYNPGLVYIILGKQAETFLPYINKNVNHILIDKHPSYYVRVKEQMSNRVFKEANQILRANTGETIEWLKHI